MRATSGRRIGYARSMTTLDDLDVLLKQALAEGALAAEVLASRSHTTTLRHEPGRAVVPAAKTDERVTVRVWVEGGRVGAMTGALSEGGELVGQALAATFESPEDPFAGPVDRLGGPPAALSIRDRRYQHLDLDARREVVEDVVQQLRSDRRFDAGPVRYRDVHRVRQFVSSKGVRLEDEGTTFRVEAELVGEGLHLRQHSASRAFATVATLPLGTQLVQRADALLQGGRTLPSGPTRVVLPPLAMSRLLLPIGELFAGEGKGRFPGGGSLSHRLHVVDDGALPGGLRTQAFDDRGVTAVPLTLVKEGAPGSRFATPSSARARGTVSTGHFFDGALRPGNLVMREGTRSINALLTEHGGPSLLIDDLPDLSGIDFATGDLSLLVDGVVMDANKPVGAMRRVRLVGNLWTMLSNIVEVCNNTDRIGSVDAAAIIADGLALEL